MGKQKWIYVLTSCPELNLLTILSCCSRCEKNHTSNRIVYRVYGVHPEIYCIYLWLYCKQRLCDVNFEMSRLHNLSLGFVPTGPVLDIGLNLIEKPEFSYLSSGQKKKECLLFGNESFSHDCTCILRFRCLASNNNLTEPIENSIKINMICKYINIQWKTFMQCYGQI